MLHIILFMLLLFLVSGGGVLTTVFSCYGDGNHQRWAVTP